ncbi:hypothetical protein Tco_1438121 [Tanacetum coccineum]
MRGGVAVAAGWGGGGKSYDDDGGGVMMMMRWATVEARVGACGEDELRCPENENIYKVFGFAPELPENMAGAVDEEGCRINLREKDVL